MTETDDLSRVKSLVEAFRTLKTEIGELRKRLEGG